MSLTILDDVTVPEGCGMMAVLDDNGDTKTIWSRNNPDEVAAARAQFDALRAKGFVAYRVAADGEKGEIMRTFDPEAEKLIMAPAMVGG